jgi:hypothetical protein
MVKTIKQQLFFIAMGTNLICYFIASHSNFLQSKKGYFNTAAAAVCSLLTMYTLQLTKKRHLTHRPVNIITLLTQRFSLTGH